MPLWGTMKQEDLYAQAGRQSGKVRRIVIRREQVGYFHSRKRDRRVSKPPTCPRPMPTGQSNLA